MALALSIEDRSRSGYPFFDRRRLDRIANAGQQPDGITDSPIADRVCALVCRLLANVANRMRVTLLMRARRNS
jgi:hypothetical protein